MKKYLLFFFLIPIILFSQITSQNDLIKEGGTSNKYGFKIGLNSPFINYKLSKQRYYYLAGTDTIWVEHVNLGINYIWTGKHTFKNVTTFDSTMYLANNQFFGSKSFVSGWAGSGWKLDYGLTNAARSNLELDDLTIRGRLSVYELLIRQIRATNGAVFVSASAKVASVAGTTVTFQDASYTGGTYMCPFAAGDLLIVQKFRPDGTTAIKLAKATVSSVSGASAVVSWDVSTFSAGDEVVRVGNTSNAARQNSIYMTSDDNNSPFIDMITGVNSWSAWASAAKTKLRIGNLTGITDAAFGGALSGEGLYAQNVYLKGVIRISNPTTFVNGDSLSLDHIKNGSTYVRTNTAEKTGAARAYNALDNLNRLKTAVIPATSITPSGAGLYMDANYLGYYDGSGWKTYMDNSGNFYLGGTGGALGWVAATNALTIANGTVNSGVIRSSATMTYDRGVAGTESGYWLGRYSTGPDVYKFFIGSSGSKYFKYDGTDLLMQGGTITGGTIQASTFRTGATGTNRLEISTSGYLDFMKANESLSGRLSSPTDDYLMLEGAHWVYGSSYYEAAGLNGFNFIGSSKSIEIYNGVLTWSAITGSYPSYTNSKDVNLYRGGSNILQTDDTFLSNSLEVGLSKFVVNPSGQLTKVNNLAASGYTGYGLVSDGTSYTPTLIVPGARTLTINGSTYDLTANRSWTISGGITTLNTLTAASQSFAIGTTGTAPTWSSVTATHTLNIPMASAATVTAGLISKTEYDTFNGKLATNGNGGSLTGLTKTQVGLANVENTALSTWAGSSNITTLGTIAEVLTFAKGLRFNSTETIPVTATDNSNGYITMTSGSNHLRISPNASGYSVDLYGATDMSVILVVNISTSYSITVSGKLLAAKASCFMMYDASYSTIRTF